MYGSEGNDWIASYNPNSIMFGGSGNDTLDGDDKFSNNDFFNCGSGTDTIRFFDETMDVKSTDCELLQD